MNKADTGKCINPVQNFQLNETKKELVKIPHSLPVNKADVGSHEIIVHIIKIMQRNTAVIQANENLTYGH